MISHQHRQRRGGLEAPLEAVQGVSFVRNKNKNKKSACTRDARTYARTHVLRMLGPIACWGGMGVLAEEVIFNGMGPSPVELLHRAPKG